MPPRLPFLPALTTLLWTPLTWAADPAPPELPSASAGLLQVLLSLGLVLGLLWLTLSWLRRLQQGGRSGQGAALKIVASTAVGTRERVVVLEVGEQWLVVGVAPGRVNGIATLTKPEASSNTPATTPTPEANKDFAAWLKHIMERSK